MAYAPALDLTTLFEVIFDWPKTRRKILPNHLMGGRVRRGGGVSETPPTPTPGDAELLSKTLGGEPQK